MSTAIQKGSTRDALYRGPKPETDQEAGTRSEAALAAVADVLALLKKINREYGITIVVITHAMSVIEEICDRVGVLEKGRLVEIGAVKDVFSNPSTDAAKRLLLTKRGEELLLESEEGR